MREKSDRQYRSSSGIGRGKERLTDCVDTETCNSSFQPEANGVLVDRFTAFLDFPVQFRLFGEEAVGKRGKKVRND